MPPSTPDHPTPAITPRQCRAARGLLGWEQGALAEASGVARATIIDFEASRTTPQRKTLARLRTALETAGIRFLHDANETGVTLSPNPDV